MFQNKCITISTGYISLMVQDRAISAKFSTPRASEQHILPKFQKIFVFRKMAAILNFRIFGKNTKLLISPKQWEIERFRQNFRPQGYLSKILWPRYSLKKCLSFEKRRPFWIFEYSPKTQKWPYLIHSAR